MINTVKGIRILYNQLKSIFNRPIFKIDEDDRLEGPFKIQMELRRERNGLVPKFIVRANPNKLSEESVNEISSLVERFAQLNLSVLMNNFNPAKQDAIMLTVNEESISMGKFLEMQETSKQAAM